MRKWFLAAVTACAACELVLDTSNLDNGKPTTDAGSPAADATSTAPDAANPADGSLTDASIIDASDAGPAENYRLTILADQPAAYWRLAEPAGATTAKDEVGAHDGAYVSVTTGATGPFTDRLGASFDNAFARIEVPDALAYAGTHPFTVESWALANAPDAGGCHHIYSREERDSNHFGYGLLQYASNGIFLERFVANTGESSQEPGIVITTLPQVFTYIVGTYDGIAARIFVNGVLTSTGETDTRSMETFASTVYIGAAGANDCTWNGSLAEVAVYPTALGADRIAAHYAARF